MSRESEKAARLAEVQACWRSSVSRYYYAAYQIVTAVLLYSNLTPPDEREAWSHEDTPDLWEMHGAPFLRSREERRRLARQLRELYKLRVIADYIGDRSFDVGRVNTARKYSGRIIKVMERILSER